MEPSECRTTIVTVSELRGSINTVDDLNGKRVATVLGSTAADYLENLRVRVIGVESIENAYTLLENEQVDAIVYDAPVLLYYVNNEGGDRFELAGEIFAREGYGIALQTDSPYTEMINQAILDLREDGTFENIYLRWFGEMPR